MGTFYVTIENSDDSEHFSHHCAGLSMESTDSDPTTEVLRTYYPPQILATCWELLFAVLSSVILSAYTLHHEVRLNAPFSTPLSIPETIEQSNNPDDTELRIQAFDPGHFSFVLDPSPALVLVFCVVLGCSVSSFCYRNQGQHRFQALIFVLATIAAINLGFGLGVNANLILLGLIPWAMCFSMLFSTAIHWLVRRCSICKNHLVYGVDEKEVLIRR